MENILYIFGTIGLTQILVQSKIMLPVRNWLADPSFDVLSGLNYIWQEIVLHPIRYFTNFASQIMSCPLCCGCWAGWACSYLLGSFSLPAGFAGSFLANFASSYLDYLEAKTILSLPEESNDE